MIGHLTIIKMNNTITQIIEEWHNNVKNNYKNIDLIKFTKHLLEYVLEKKTDEHKKIIYDFIDSRMNFTSDFPSKMMIDYMKICYNETNETTLKKKFKLVKELGKEGRENLVKSLKYEVKKINEIKNKDKQIVKQKTTVKDLEETVRKHKKEIAKLTLENDIINKRNEELCKDKKELEQKNNELNKKNYEDLQKLLIEMEKSSEKELCIKELSNEIKILNIQMNHLKEK